ncbi:MAG: hypothetical protein IAF38_03500 [Bacteroidia bacterium]|nr:hypothetical protein [Bacteroidia bacterium]
MKFLDNINQKIARSAKVAVLEVNYENETTFFSLGIYESKKNAVLTKEEFFGEIEIELILLKLKDKNTPIVLCVDGKGILNKKLNFSLEDLDETVAGKVIPNANADDFYYEAISINETSSLVSMMRRSIIDPILEKLKEKGLFVTECHLGPLVIGCIGSVLTKDADTSDLIFRNYKLVISKEGVLEIGAVTQDTKIPETENENGTQKNLLIFAGACSYFSGWSFTHAKTHCPIVNERKTDFTEKKKFSFYATTAVIFFLVTLLINFFVFQHFHNKKQQLESQIGWQENALKSYDELKKNLDEKMTFALGSGILSPDNLAFLSDQLGSTVPTDIKLNRMTVFPLEKKMENGDEHSSFNKQLISVKGQSLSGSGINDWIKRIKQKDFVKEVLLTNYKQDDENAKGFFSLEITLK